MVNLRKNIFWLFKWTVILTIMMLIIMYAGSYVQSQIKEKERLENLAKVQDQKIQELAKQKELSNIQLKESLVEEMLNKLSSEEWGEYTEGDGKLRYANDPTKGRYTECRRVGGARNINCDSWTVYQWKIPTAQMFYEKIYGEKISEVEMLIKLHDNNFLHKFTAQAIIKNKGAIYHWTTAKNSKDYYNVVIDTIRKLDN